MERISSRMGQAFFLSNDLGKTVSLEARGGIGGGFGGITGTEISHAHGDDFAER